MTEVSDFRAEKSTARRKRPLEWLPENHVFSETYLNAFAQSLDKKVLNT